MKTYTIPEYKIVVKVIDGSISTIESGLREALIGKDSRDEDELVVDALESLVLAHACAGLDISSPAYVEGLRTSLEAIANHA